MTMLGVLIVTAAVLLLIGSVIVLWIALGFPTGRAVEHWIEDTWFDFEYWLKRKARAVRDWWGQGLE